MARSVSGRVRGLFTAIITPFDEEGRVDLDSLSDLVEFQVSKGAEGLYPCGSTGLGPMLRPDERKAVAEAVIGTARKRIPVVVQVGAADTATAVELARHAERAGADAVASLTPYYYKPGEKAIARHFETVTRAVGIPLLAYNIPQFTGNNLGPGLVSSLARAGTIAGIKDSARDLIHLQDVLEAVPDDFVVMNGTEEYGLFAIMSGADGLVSGGASALPELFKSMVTAQRKGDYKAATAAHLAILEFKDLVGSGPISAYYGILKERGIDCGNPRAPFLPLQKEGSVRIVKTLKRKGLI